MYDYDEPVRTPISIDRAREIITERFPATQPKALKRLATKLAKDSERPRFDGYARWMIQNIGG